MAAAGNDAEVVCLGQCEKDGEKLPLRLDGPS